MQVIYTQ